MTVTLNWISSSFLLVSSISLFSPMTSPSWLWRFSVSSRQFSLRADRSLVILKSSKSLSWDELIKWVENIWIRTYVNNQTGAGTETHQGEKDQVMVMKSHHCTVITSADRSHLPLQYFLQASEISAQILFRPTPQNRPQHNRIYKIYKIGFKFTLSLSEVVRFIGQFTCKIW